MRKLIWMLAALLALAPAAFAQTAQEMTDRCAFSSVGKKTLGRMTDGDYRTYWASSSNGSAYVEIEAEDAIGGVYVQFYDDAAALDVQTRDASGAWQTVAQTDGAPACGFFAPRSHDIIPIAQCPNAMPPASRSPSRACP